MTKKKKLKFSFKTFLIVLTAVLVGWVVYQNWQDIIESFNHLNQTNVAILLPLVPEQLFMYYACGQIFFAYLDSRQNVRKFSKKEKLRISTELNFVNHAVPAGGVGGLAFLTYRLSPFNVSAGQASFLYIFRYAVTTVINYLQALVAILILFAFNLVPDTAKWIIPVALLMNAGVFVGLWLIVYVASSKKRIGFFAKTVEGVFNLFAKVFTLGRKKRIKADRKIEEYFLDINNSVGIAKNNKKLLKRPIVWGMVYSLCEVVTYYIVALSLGRPELIAYIMIGEAIGSVFDGIVPYGLYELGMAGVMIALGVDFPTATIITVMTRVITLVFTIISGSMPYYKAIKGQRDGK
ncbi:flippase-like domain-containing protein [Candidatus Saccharibacteria bacterium]|nr:flippase-like domain-containing protein [Candidatus Saccharibacteria bacterium]